MGTSKRRTTTKQDRIDLVINSSNPTHNPKSKLSEYLSQPNVKKYNAMITSKSFDNASKRGYPRLFTDREECLTEIEEYFKLCYECDIIPTIAGLSLYLGVNRDTLYNYANNSKLYDYSDVVKLAINTCQSYQETAVLEGSIPSVPFIFLSKNYFGLKDTTDVRFNQDNQDETINSNTMNVIKEQIETERQSELLDYTE